MRQLTIDRGKWISGQATRDGIEAISRLLNPVTERQCCVGHYLSSLGMPFDVLSSQATASDVAFEDSFPKEARWLLKKEGDEGYWDNRFGNALYKHNDREYNGDGKPVSNAERERKIKRIFKNHGVEVTFVGEYPAKDY